MDRCDIIREAALMQAVEMHRGQPFAAVSVIETAEVFHKFLLGTPQSTTRDEVGELEILIREDEAFADTQPEERTYTGDNVTLPADVEAANGVI